MSPPALVSAAAAPKLTMEATGGISTGTATILFFFKDLKRINTNFSLTMYVVVQAVNREQARKPRIHWLYCWLSFPIYCNIFDDFWKTLDPRGPNLMFSPVGISTTGCTGGAVMEGGAEMVQALPVPDGAAADVDGAASGSVTIELISASKLQK